MRPDRVGEAVARCVKTSWFLAGEVAIATTGAASVDAEEVRLFDVPDNV